MTLTLFFRLIVMSIFQKQVIHDKKSTWRGEKMSYNNQLFFCLVIVCKDGWNISLQIHHSNYCISENGYREAGHTMHSVEFCMPSEDDKDLHKHTECYGYPSYTDNGDEIPFDKTTFSSIDRIGRIPLETVERICNVNHGGIDWEATISIEAYKLLINGKRKLQQ